MFLGALRAEPDGEDLLARLTAHDLARIESGFNVGWEPLAVHDSMMSTVLEATGQERFTLIWRSTFQRSIQQKFLASFFELLQPRAGVSVLPVARRAPRVYEYLSRGTGKLRWVEGPGGGELRLTGFPKPYDLQAWAISNLGALQVGAQTLGRPPDIIRMTEVSPADGAATFEVLDS